jgi:predicted permease
MPAGFEIHGPSDVWAPLALDDRTRKTRQSQYLTSVARLKPGVTLQQAQAEMSAIREGIEQAYPNVQLNEMKIVPLREQIVGPVGPALLILFGAVGFVLLIACANIASLQLARTASRQREMAVRTALGARRARIIRQLLTESLMLALAAGAAGLLVAILAVHLLVAAIPASSPLASFSGFREIGIDKTALAFTLATALLTGIVFGLAPALKSASPDLNETLKEGGRWAAGGLRTRRLRSLLVISEIALSLVLLIGSGLMVKSFNGLMKVDPGFDPRNVLTMQFYLLPFKYKQPAQVIAFYRQALDQIRNSPGVLAAGLTSYLPLGASDNADGFSIEGQPDPPIRDERIAHVRTISPEYFKSLGIAIERGRPFMDEDNETAPGVAIVNQTLARQYWPDRDPIGQRIRTSSSPGSPPQPWLSIVGIARDVRHTGLSTVPEPELYEPYFQNADQGATLVVRTALDPASLIPTIRGEILKLDKDQPVYAIKSMEAVLSDSLLLNRLPMILLSVFATVALVLAAVGIYGVIAYSVVQRTHEIGIRIALGAATRNVLALVLKESGILTFTGLALGMAAALALTRLMATLLFGVTPTDLATFVGVSVVLALVALMASYVPARRAAKVDPVVALRDE